MKTLLILLLALCLVTSTQAQAPVAPDSAPVMSADELDQLLGPVALYPDSLIALVLPASTVPSDIVLASRFLSANIDPAQIPNQPWDDSVKALARYPGVLQWMAQNLEWTAQLGDAFVSQPAAVMESVQRLRARAQAAGNLANTAQQEVDVDNGNISIEPTDADDLYVPQYDPNAVYDDGYAADGGPLVTFGTGYPIGPWLNYGIDWRRRGIYRGDWRGGDFRGRGDAGIANITNARQWHPDLNRGQRWAQPAVQGARAISQPKPLPGVTITPRTRATGALSRPPARDFTGRGKSAPSFPRPRSTHSTTTAGATMPGRPASAGKPAASPPVAAVISRPPVESFSRPAPVRQEIQRSAPAPERPSGAFHMSSGAAAHSFSAQGAQSRGRR